MNETQEYIVQFNYIRDLDADIVFEGCKVLCRWLTDGESDREPHKRKQPCPNCGGHDRFRYSPEYKRFFCNQCKPKGGWDGIMLVKSFGDYGELTHMEATQLLAEATGYGNDNALPTEQKQSDKPKPKLLLSARYYLKEDSGVFREVYEHRPQIDFNAYEGAGAEAFSDGRGNGIAIPMFGNDGELSGYVRYYTNGGKPMNAAGSKSGIVGTDSIQNLLQKRQAKIVFLTAGVSDRLTLSGAIAKARLEDGYYAFTTGGGESEKFEKFDSLLRSALEGKTIAVIVDNDEAGEKGAQARGKYLAQFAADVRLVRLPSECTIQGNDVKIKDLRDFLSAGNTFEDLLKLFDEAESVKTESTPAESSQNTPSKRSRHSKRIARPILIRASEVVEKAIAWLWENKIPLGMLSLIAGLAGVGKSFLTVFMTAVITNGWKWPDGTPSEQGSVLFFYGEEGIADTYKKRFRANGADQSKIVFLDGVELVNDNDECSEAGITLQMVDVIERAIHDTAEKTGLPVKMVVIDPISNYWGDKKENSNAEVRSVLKPLQHLAEKTGVAFVLIQHVGKADKEHAQQKVLGSTGIVAACRSVWGVFIDPDDNTKRVFAPLKVNCGYNHTAVSYRIAPPNGTVEIVDVSIENLTGDDIVRSQKQVSKRGPKTDKVGDCADEIAERLKEGDAQASEMLDSLKAEGFGTSTIREAKKQLGVKSVGKGKNTLWHLPTDSTDSVVENAD